MPETISQSSSSEFFSIKEGRNIRAKLYAESAFYLDTSLEFTQNINQKYGKVETAVTQYRTTSVVNYTGKVFAICTGQAFLQPMQDDVTKVNLILRPFKQPINGLPIKYFIYRGLKKSDFFVNGKLLAKSEFTSEFINHVRDEYDRFYNQNKNLSKPEFLASFLGFREIDDILQNENELIDEYFFKTSETEEDKVAFELPIIQRGTYLGNAEGNIGIDIILNNGDYYIENDANPFQLNLKFAREKEHKLRYDNYSYFQKKLIRENATIFMDIAAFYGLHSENGKIHLNNSSDVAKSPESIFNLIKNYQTAATTYLYIQSNRQRSYNFYGNYKISANDNHNLKIGTDVNNLSAMIFGGEDWPVLSFKNEQNSEKLFVSLINDKNYFDKVFYIDIANPKGENENNLFIKDLKNATETKDVDFITPIEFKITKSAGIIKLIYVGKDLDETYINNESLYLLNKHHNVVRDVFPVINAKTHLKGNGNFYKISFNEKYFVNFKLFSNLQSVSTINNSVVFYQGKKKIGQDILVKEKVLFGAKKEDTIDSNEINNVNLIFGTNSSMFTSLPKDVETKILMQNLYGDTNYNFYSNKINDSGNIVKLIKLKYNEQYDTTYFSIGITKEELDKLLAIVPENATNVKLYLEEEEINPLLDIEAKKSYFKYSLGINFENSNGGLAVLSPTQKVYVYGESIHFFASSDFAEYENLIAE